MKKAIITNLKDFKEAIMSNDLKPLHVTILTSAAIIISVAIVSLFGRGHGF